MTDDPAIDIQGQVEVAVGSVARGSDSRTATRRAMPAMRRPART